MTFSVDSHFLLGHMHQTSGTTCQDYAVSGQCGQSVYAVISDGCSGGGQHTDVGARIVALTAAKSIQTMLVGKPSLDPQWIYVGQVNPMLQTQANLGLDWTDLAATCMSVIMTPEVGLIHLEGDGVIAAKRRTGELLLTSYEWETNRPYYPIYSTSKQLESDFIETHGGDLSATRVTANTDSPLGIRTARHLTLKEGMNGITLRFTQDQLQELEAIAIFSDGVNQIDCLPLNEVVKELLAFKKGAGAFVKRRMNAFVQKINKEGHRPLDDLSAAVIRIQP